MYPDFGPLVALAWIGMAAIAVAVLGGALFLVVKVLGWIF